MKIKKMNAKEFWPLLDHNSPKVFTHKFYPAYQQIKNF